LRKTHRNLVSRSPSPPSSTNLCGWARGERAEASVEISHFTPNSVSKQEQNARDGEDALSYFVLNIQTQV
jgi:hypothetical protein